MAIITGTGGNDTIRTAAAGGSLGGLANATDGGDSITGLAGDDLIVGGAGDDTIDGGTGGDYLHGGGGNDILRTGEGTNPGRGERLFGESGDDDLTGSLDTSFLHFLFGGDGNDTIRGRDNGSNLADYADRALGVVANLAAGTAVVGGSETDTLVGVRGLRGGAGNDRITGTDFNDLILPGLGNNVVVAGLGTADQLRYGDIAGSVAVDLHAGTATKSADGSTDLISGVEIVQGTNGDDTLLGDAGDNEFRPIAGADLVDGRGGFDFVVYSSFFRGSAEIFAPTGDFGIAAGVSVNLTTGTATDSWGFTDTLISIENVAGTAFADDLTGIAIADGSRSQLRGLAGNDTLRGTGTDRSISASYLADPARVLVNLSGDDLTLAGTLVAAHTAKDGFGGTDTIIAIQSVRGSAFNDIIVGSALADRLEGEGGDDEIRGGAGEDQLRGNAGNDVLYGEEGDDDIRGGAGTDQYFGGAGYDNLDFADGTPTHRVEASLTTGVIIDQFGNVENLGAVNDIEALGGSALNDVLEGKTISGTIVMLYGQGGDDTLLIGSGQGIEVAANYSLDPAGIVADLSLATRQVADGYGGHDTLVGINAVRGSRHDDVLLGNNADNWFRGEAGNDVIDGRGGFDIASYSNTHSSTPLLSGITAVMVNGAGTVQDGLGFTDTLSGIEQISGTRLDDRMGISGSQAMTLLGNEGNDLLYGGAGDDTLRGGANDDWLFGNAGQDTLQGEAGNDIIYAGSDKDIVSGGDGSDTLVGEAGDDTIDGGAGDDKLYGNDGDDVIVGGDGRDSIQGGNGADRIEAGEGDDVAFGQAGDDTLLGQGGNDLLDGGADNDRLDGGAGGDILTGGAGADWLKGGAGLDTLTGGADADRFVLANLAADRDWISDFQSGTDLLEIDAALFGSGLAPGGLDAARLVVGANPVATLPGAGQFLFSTTTGVLRWDSDGGGGAAAQVIATLVGITTLGTSDFIIV
jgi:Ca2+-binding RTX toxin-like protein